MSFLMILVHFKILNLFCQICFSFFMCKFANELQIPTKALFWRCFSPWSHHLCLISSLVNYILMLIKYYAFVKKWVFFVRCAQTFFGKFSKMVCSCNFLTLNIEFIFCIQHIFDKHKYFISVISLIFSIYYDFTIFGLA